MHRLRLPGGQAKEQCGGKQDDDEVARPLPQAVETTLRCIPNARQVAREDRAGVVADKAEEALAMRATNNLVNRDLLRLRVEPVARQRVKALGAVGHRSLDKWS